jgi:hypothetical protein
MSARRTARAGGSEVADGRRMQRKIARIMRRRKAAKAKRGPLLKTGRPKRPARAPPLKVRTPATTRGGVKAPKRSRKLGVRCLSQLPAPKRHRPLSEIIWKRRVRLAATHYPGAPVSPSPRKTWTPSVAPLLRAAAALVFAKPISQDRKLAARFAAAARRFRRAAEWREERRRRDADWKDQDEKRARLAYSRELTRSYRAGVEAERKKAALAADEAEHKAKTAQRPIPRRARPWMTLDWS